MKSYTDVDEMRTQSAAWRRQGLRIALVATMGNLHVGHLSLVAQAKLQADKVVVSIFVNPLQFAPHEDFDSYPRTLAEDCELLAKQGVDAVFCPSDDVMYQSGESTFINYPPLLY